MTQEESKHVALKITFYVINLLCFLTDTLYFICIDKHIGMTTVKNNKFNSIIWDFLQ